MKIAGSPAGLSTLTGAKASERVNANNGTNSNTAKSKAQPLEPRNFSLSPIFQKVAFLSRNVLFLYCLNEVQKFVLLIYYSLIFAAFRLNCPHH
jgi:hypothetical protein